MQAYFPTGMTLSSTMGNKATAGLPSAQPLLGLGISRTRTPFLVPDPKAACRPRLALIVHDCMYTCIAEPSTLPVLIGTKAYRVEATIEHTLPRAELAELPMCYLILRVF